MHNDIRLPSGTYWNVMKEMHKFRPYHSSEPLNDQLLKVKSISYRNDSIQERDSPEMSDPLVINKDPILDPRCGKVGN